MQSVSHAMTRRMGLAIISYSHLAMHHRDHESCSILGLMPLHVQAHFLLAAPSCSIPSQPTSSPAFFSMPPKPLA